MADGTNPASNVFAGSARMPAPIVVPATKAVAPATDVVAGRCTGGSASPTVMTGLSAAGLSVGGALKAAAMGKKRSAIIAIVDRRQSRIRWPRPSVAGKLHTDLQA